MTQEHETLFTDTERNLTTIYNLLVNTDLPMVEVLNGKELKAFFAVMDMCQAIYELETLGK